MQVAKLKMTDTESLAEYRKRIKITIKRCKTAAAIGIKATALSFIAFVMPSTGVLIARIIEAINVTANKAFQLCEAYRGNVLGYCPTTPTTIDELFDELEKAQARTDSKSIIKAKKKVANKEFIANINANFGDMDIVSMFTTGSNPKYKKRGRDGKPMFPQVGQLLKPRADIKDSLRVQIDPAKVRKEDAQYLVRELTKLHPELALENMKFSKPQKYKKGKGRQREPSILTHQNHISDSDSAEESNDSSTEGGENDDDGEDSSDENVVVSNFNLLSSSMYVALMNMNFKKISANELCLIL